MNHPFAAQVLGVAGASWLGRATPSDVSTAFSPGVRGGAWAANVVPGGTVLYLALATAPMLNPLRDSVAALAGREVADGAVTAAVLALVVLSVVLASTLESLLIFSLSGATGVCVTCYVVPVACLWSIPRDRDPKDYVGYRRSKEAFLRDVLGPGLALFLRRELLRAHRRPRGPADRRVGRRRRRGVPGARGGLKIAR